MQSNNFNVSQGAETDYATLQQQAAALVSGELDLYANLANLSALLNEHLAQINWVGFYLTSRTSPGELILGPFQGRVACVRIPFGKGVCGTAAATQSTQLVDDVHAFPGHIACDVASNSEIVLPIVVEGKVVAVLDIDSPEYNRFNQGDREGLEALLPTLQQLNWAHDAR